MQNALSAESQLRAVASSSRPLAEEADYVDLKGTIRQCTAEETLRELQPLLPRVGITRIANVTGLDCIGIPVSLCVRPTSRSLSVSQGKGVTNVLADVSAAMESIESFHSENVREADLVGSFNHLKGTGHSVLAPSTFARGPLNHQQPLEELDMEWIQATDLITGETHFLPRAIVCLDCTSSVRQEVGLSISSNGLASGNSILEAMCHGLYEVIERDSHARWEQLPPEETMATEIDVDTIDGYCADMVEKFRRADIQVRVWDATGAVGLPTFVCRIRGIAELRGLSPFGGAGCHTSRDIALSRALTEAAQSRLTMISGSRDDALPHYYESQRRMAGDKELEAPRGRKPLSSCPSSTETTTFSQGLLEATRRLAEAGFEHALVVNLCRDDLNIPVVHVVVPGMIGKK